MTVPLLLQRVSSPTVLLRIQCLQIISNAISVVVLTDNDRTGVPEQLSSDHQVLDAVLTLHASGHNYESVPSLPLPYRLTEEEWAALLVRAALHSLTSTLKGVINV